MDRYRQAFAVTPADATDIRAGMVWDAVRVGGAGNLNVEMEDGKVVLISGMLAGESLHIAIRKVLSTSTTATLITVFKA
jgi:hypothetical protein